MTNLEKLIQVLGETFPGTAFSEDEIYEYIDHCTFLDCKRCKFQKECGEHPTYDFWHREYVSHDLKPEPDSDIYIGFVVIVDDDGTLLPYSGSIHPDYSRAAEEVDNAEYHGWIASIKKVIFQFIKEGGGKNA